MGNYLTLFVNVHQAAQRQSVLSLIQRTDSIGKTFRQHWHNAVCQINTGSTFQCFPVQSTVILYIVAYICDMDSQMVNVPLFCQGNRIIQVFGIFAINSDCLQMSQIQSSISVCIQHMIRNTLSLLHYFLRKFTWDSEALDDCQDICTRCSDISQILLNFSFRILISGTIICNHHDYFITIFYSCRFFSRNEDIFGKFRIITDHKTEIPI